MRGFRGRKAIVGLAVTGAAAFGAAHALGVTQTITTTPACCTFSQPTFTIDPGQVATFQDLDGVSHNVTASGNGPDGEVLFSSDTITSGQAPVNGTQYLGTGSYPFVCTVHPGMAANLVVTGNGSPVARPGVVLTVVSKKLDRVLASGKLKVKVSSSAVSSDVVLTARKGAKKLGSKGNIDVAAGASPTVKLPLTQSGKNALKDLGSAKVKVSSAVPFGSPSTAKRKLR
ncbi:MAG: plastocyanin/azurin family copper-binding protein [Actinomycetota bacterium]